ncbi:MAG TPA: Ig-like domain-containing protein, partial [Gemmatimonadales bacterium]|nr:Ig-like domain-containing protein [Gemmatimonadales bacterium]
GQCTLTPTRAGNETLTATYAGQPPFAGSSGTAPHQVVLAPTKTLLSSNPNPSAPKQSVTFTATVTSDFQTPLAGSVLFGLGRGCPSPTTRLGSKSVSSTGVAMLSTTKLPTGTDSVFACYQGTATFAASPSAVLLQVVNSGR